MKKVMVIIATMFFMMVFSLCTVFAQDIEKIDEELYGKKKYIIQERSVIYKYSNATYKCNLNLFHCSTEVLRKSNTIWLYVQDFNLPLEADSQLWRCRDSEEAEIMLEEVHRIRLIGETDKFLIVSAMYEEESKLKSAIFIFEADSPSTTPRKKLQGTTKIKIKDNKIFANGEEVLLE